MFKLLFPHQFPNEPPIRIVTGDFSKLASFTPPEVSGFLKDFKPEEGKSYLLVNALGSGEVWGANVNGDYFPERALMHKGASHGYKTFELHAHVYRHHVNKDPAKAMGVVKVAAYNPVMHRVELLLEVDNEKGEGLLKKVAAGEYPDWSMGCFQEDTQTRMADGTLKAIQDVSVGDCVFTHAGRIGRVKELHRRSYSGRLCSIQARAHEPIHATEEHPFFVLKKDEVLERGRLRDHVDVARAKWICAKHIEEGDYLVQRIPSDVATPEFASMELARMLGYYAAEGHTTLDHDGKINGLCLSTGTKDAAMHEDVERIARKLGVTVCRRDVPERNAVYLEIYDPRLAETCFRLCGKYAREKRLDASLLRWHPDLQLHFLAAFITGDGWQAKGKVSGAVYISTASVALAEQLVTMCGRVGMLAHINYISHKAGTGFSRHDTEECQIYISKATIHRLSEVCAVVKPYDVIKSGAIGRRIIDGHLLTPVTEIASIDVAGMPVFNFEVDRDDSYVVEDFGVHNCKVPFDVCSICAHQSKKVTEYCDHLKYAMNKIAEDGRRHYAVNTLPKFFDISEVIVGADKTAKLLKKVASAKTGYSSALLGLYVYGEDDEKTAAPKTAEMDKAVPSEAASSPVLDKTVRNLQASEPALAKKDVAKLASFELPDILSTLSFSGIVLKPAEFQSIVLRKTGNEKAAEEFEKKGVVFPPISDADVDGLEFSGDETIHPDNVKLAVFDVIKPYVPHRSIFEAHIHDRVDRMRILGIKTAAPAEKCAGLSEMVPLLGALGLAYLLYRRGLPIEGRAFEELLIKKPWMGPVILGGAVGGVNVIDAIAGPSPRSEAANHLQRAYVKVGAAWKTIGTVLGPLGLAYLTAASAARKEYRGEELSGFERLMKDYPAPLGVLGVYGLVKARGALAAKAPSAALQAVRTALKK